ncbi:hypothetical protein V8F20_010177, partial [Naviculisporaceae sp. PSN 640]
MYSQRGGKMASKNKKLASRLQNNYVLSPITALDIYHATPYRSLVLAGEDTYLRIYDVATSKPLGQVKIFHSQPIHGIHVSKSSVESNETETRVLIWGGQSVSVLPHASLQALIEGEDVPQPREFKAPDWIYDGIISPYDSDKGVLVTAHNEIVPFSTTTSSGGENVDVTFGPLTSPSRPILYSANLAWLSPETVLVAGGTVFGEIIVWKYYTDVTRSSQWELLYVFTGHEGSIFGVSISPEIELTPDGPKIRMLASCSDDRTIRIWDITEANRDRSVPEAPAPQDAKAVLGDARETGFGGNNSSSNSEAKEEHQNDSARCLAVAMGHLSRIWHVKFTGKTNHHSPKEIPIEVWSFGEDCTRQRWELSLDIKRWEESVMNGYATTEQGEPIGVLKHCGTNPCHIGKNIWSAAVSLAPGGGDDRPLVVSGGADGKIAISGGQSGSDSGSRYSDMDLTLSVDEVLASLGVDTNDITPEKQVKKSAKEGFQRYAFLSEQSFLATTTSGRLFLGSTVKDSINWEIVDISDAIMADLKIYNVVKSPAPGIAVLGNASGKLYLFQQQQTSSSQTIQELTQLPNKVSDIICLKDPSQKPNTWTIIATVLGQDHALMLTFEPDSRTGDTKLVTSRRIDLTQHFVITSAAFCNGRLILGSRIGVLAVQKAKEDGSFETEYSRKDCKTKDAVTCIIPLPGSNNSFVAGCRDGRYRIYTLNDNKKEETEEAVLHLQHEISPPLGMIEGAWFMTSFSGGIELVLYGFRGNNFIVWSETSRQELASVECGGAHRPFDTIAPLSQTGGKLKLVFTKAAQMHFYSQSGPLLRALKEGGHGRELRGVAASTSGGAGESKYRYIATAAEDTTIRIWQYNDNKADGQISFKPLAVLEKHSAGIQHLKWHGTTYLLSSAGQEEFFIWRVTRIESEYESLAVVCEAVYSDKSADGDLRIMDFDVSSLPLASATSSAQEGEEERLLISFALSNSEIKSYVYSKSRGFRLLARGRYTGACLTQIRHLQVVTRDDDDDGEGVVGIQLLTGSTDGYLAIWATSPSSSREYSLSSVVKVHQSTVKSLDIARINQDNSAVGWLVATGGDDNALGFTRLVKSASSIIRAKITATNRSRIAGAHAAAITGLTFVDGGKVEESRDILHVATASNDQRVKLWMVELNGEETQPPKVSLLDNQYSAVADPGDVEVIPSTSSSRDGSQKGKGKFMVGGVGMEVWDL